MPCPPALLPCPSLFRSRPRRPRPEGRVPEALLRPPAPGLLARAREALAPEVEEELPVLALDRKSTRLNSSHRCISYAVFCLKKKKTAQQRASTTLTIST